MKLLSVLLPLLVACSDDPTPATDTDAQPIADATVQPDSSGPMFEAGVPPRQFLDRAGRPYTLRLVLNPENKDAYNQCAVTGASFQGQCFFTTVATIGEGAAMSFGPDLQASTTKLDKVDGTLNWTPDGGAGPNGLSGMYLADNLFVDPKLPFSPSGFLSVELEAAGLATATTCGGRFFDDDALDKTMSFVVKKAVSGVSDGVSAPTKPAALTFPYLAPPN
jgi:hypothetical protein